MVRTLALLEIAAEKKILDLPTTLQKLRATSFRLPEQSIAAALERDELRKRETKWSAAGTGRIEFEAQAIVKNNSACHPADHRV